MRVFWGVLIEGFFTFQVSEISSAIRLTIKLTGLRRLERSISQMFLSWPFIVSMINLWLGKNLSPSGINLFSLPPERLSLGPKCKIKLLAWHLLNKSFKDGIGQRENVAFMSRCWCWIWLWRTHRERKSRSETQVTPRKRGRLQDWTCITCKFNQRSAHNGQKYSAVTDRQIQL